MPMMIAKYEGTCQACGRRVSVGASQWFERDARGKGMVWHEACAPASSKPWTALPQPAERGTTPTRIRGALYRPDGSAREIGDIILLPTMAQQAWNLPPYIMLKAASPPGPDDTLMLDVVPASQTDAAAGATTSAPPADAVAGALAMAGGAQPSTSGSNPTYLDWDDVEKVWFWTGDRDTNGLLKDPQGKWILQANYYDEVLRDYRGNVIIDERTGKPKKQFRRWQTKYPEAAVRLKAYAGPRALQALQGHVQAVEASKATDAELSCPSPPNWNYRPYQRAGIRYAMAREGGVLIGDSAGTGKTGQALGVINCTPEAKRVLVICPNTAVGNWHVEAKNWLVKEWVIWSPKTGKEAAPDGSDRLLVVTGYGKLSRKSVFLDSLFKVDWDILVVDESHKVKNLDSIRGQNVIGEMKKGARRPTGGLVGKTKRVLFLSGTPIPNNPAEIWPTLVSLAPDEFKSQLSFGIRYGGWRMEYNDYMGKDIPVKPTVKQLANPVTRDQLIPLSRREELQERMRACCMIRRTLEEAIPEMEGRKQRHIVVLPTPPQLAKDKDLAWSGNINDALNLDTEDINIAFTTISKKRELIAQLKAPLAVEHVRNLLDGGAQKIIVFGFHHTMLDALQEGLTSAPNEKDEDAGETVLRPEQVLRIDGSVDTKIRSGKGSIAERFQTDPDVRVIILQWEAASEAINLFAANRVVITEAPWTPTTVDQMEGRAYRSGQEQVVISQFLVFDHTVEALLVKLLLAKMEVAKGILDKPTASVTGPSIGQLLADAGVRQSEQAAADAAKDALKQKQAEARVTEVEAQRAEIAAMPEGKERDKAQRELQRQDADKLTPEQILTVVQAARTLADMDTDRAKEKNFAGFNKLDGSFGHRLAGEIPSELPPRLAWAGAKMLIKYKGQLSRDVWESLYEIVYGNDPPTEKEKKPKKSQAGRPTTAAELAKVLTPADVAEMEREEPAPEIPPPAAPASPTATYKVKEEIGTQCNECGWTTKRIGARKCGACDGDDMMAPLYKVPEVKVVPMATHLLLSQGRVVKWSRSELVAAVHLYWSPRQQRLDPHTMGNSGATDVRPLVRGTLLGKATTDWIHGDWTAAQQAEWNQLAQETLDPAHKGAQSRVAFHLSAKSYPRGYQQWHQVFDPRYAYDLEELERYAEGAREKYPQLAAWIERYVQARIEYGKRLETSYESKVAPIIDELVTKGEQGIEPGKEAPVVKDTEPEPTPPTPDPDEAHDQGEHDDATEPVPGCTQCAKQFSPEARAERLAEAHEDGDHRDAYEPVPGCAQCEKRFAAIAASQRFSDGPVLRLNDWQVSVLEEAAGQDGGVDAEDAMDAWIRGVFPGGRGTRHYSGLDWISAEDEGPEEDPGTGPELRHWWKFTLLPWAGFPRMEQDGRSPRKIKVPGTPQAREELWQALRSLVNVYEAGVANLRGIERAHAEEAVKATEALAEKVIALNYPQAADLFAGATERLPAGTAEVRKKATPVPALPPDPDLEGIDLDAFDRELAEILGEA